MRDDGLNGPLPWLSVSGDRIVDDTGQTVRLAGVGLGGWMNMENFITGYPGNEENIRRVMRERMGAHAYEAFFDSFYTAFFDDADAAFIASVGMNSVRIPVNYRHFEDDARPFELKEEGFARLDRVVSSLARHGVYSIIDLHALPGRQNQHWHSDNPTHIAEFWNHPHFQDRVVHLWEALADRYKDRPEVAGYNPINEPSDPTGVALPAFYDRLERAIRAVDPRHVLFLDGNKYSTDFSFLDDRADPLPNAVYTAHDYALPGITSATQYPGITRGEYFDRDVVEQTFLRRTEYMRRTDTPIWIGEFGPVYSDDRSQDPWRLRLLRDQLDIYRDHGASWALWTYKDIGLQGLRYADPSSDYMVLTAPVRAKKARLGADSWGGSDAGVRDVLDPIDALFDREFPDFAPWPWGRQPHVAVLVRHILFAEPLAEEFGAAFSDVNPEQAADLARAFAFAQTVERNGLTDLLREHLTG
ncbi:glycoside hydrolase family 5 protein [Microbacterium sp. UBA3394]|uniref:glycoside hydrolase family 5 protein n=1 Tax=Microbacterium sp. UBA3394 TaxID=1946945 RepID=UPI00257D16E7|nr:cellulase family glycosylhydrolase [Microbacterium sp. UBA3394]|tara:strand:+ start:1270 stop:2685 length:1416 start_codon:yes stop_codon:yes gene_type:complete